MASINSDENLSPNFTLHELLASQTATRKGITEQFEPSEEIIDNLKFLCENLLEKLLTLNEDKPFFISSGYRCSRLNKAVGGVKNSQHVNGEAVDIDFNSKKANKDFYSKIKNSDILFDQLLNEYEFSWVHVSLKKEGNRQQALDIG